jgi:hypothetical protein
MHRKIAAAVVALVLFAGPSTVSFAQNPGGTPMGTNPTTEGIGNTSSTHNPRPQYAHASKRDKISSQAAIVSPRLTLANVRSRRGKLHAITASLF